MKINQDYTILGIETSCDETAAAITVDRRIFSNVIWSQIEIHQPWGGVVPNLARRAHEKHLDEVIESAIKRGEATRKRMKEKKPINWKSIDAIAVTQGPGLAIALGVGIDRAKKLAKKHHKPLIAVNHLEGGSGPFAQTKMEFPLLGLLVSGGHTQLVLVNSIGQYQVLGETLDDAAGEAFDKVAKMLNLGYPGGPIISQLAKRGNPNRFTLPIPMARNKSLNFSFSGLKTACLYKLRDIPEKKKDGQFLADFSASFQKSLVRSITLKLKLAIEKHRPRQVVLGGGVINNFCLRQETRRVAKKFQIPLFVPYGKQLFTDNAAMIGISAFYQAQRGKFVKAIDQLDRKANLGL